jgi:transposase
MNVLYSHAAALDIGKRETVCALHTPRHQEIRTFAMTTQRLLELADWLNEHGVTHVAMESTGVYWKPIFNLLEGYDFTLLLVNPREFRAVPGRKTDVRDAEWLVDLLRHGLLKASFVPPKQQRELRELVRYRRKLIEERTREYNRLEKTLEGANIKLGAVASKMTGKSVREMLWALAHGETDPEAIAAKARGRLKQKHAELVEALEGFIGAHQRFLLAEQLGHLEELDGRIERISREVAERLGPFEAQLTALETIPGVGRRTAEDLVAEIGLEMRRFPTSRHLASWAKLCPGTNASAGKRKSGKTGPGNRYLRTALVEAAHATARKKGSYLHAQYHRLAARRGKKRAAVAVGHSMLVIAYHLLREGGVYEDLGPNYFDEQKEQHVVSRLQHRLERLGYEVTVVKKAA